MDLQSGTVCLEDSVTSSKYRGQGIAPITWSDIASILAREGAKRIITKIEERNVASRRAIVKAGYHEVVLMDYRYLTGWSRTRISLLSGTPSKEKRSFEQMLKLAK